MTLHENTAENTETQKLEAARDILANSYGMESRDEHARAFLQGLNAAAFVMDVAAIRMLARRSKLQSVLDETVKYKRPETFVHDLVQTVEAGGTTTRKAEIAGAHFTLEGLEADASLIDPLAVIVMRDAPVPVAVKEEELGGREQHITGKYVFGLPAGAD